MPSDQTPRDYTVAEINQTQKDIAQPRDLSADQLFAACTARAQLAVAAALLDIADAIRGDGTGSAVERAMDRMTEAMRNGRPS